MKDPIRTCIVCRAKANKNSLLRLNYKDNILTIDKKGNMPGRGAYICKNPECMEKLSLKNINHAMKDKIKNTNINIIEILRNDDMDM